MGSYCTQRNRTENVDRRRRSKNQTETLIERGKRNKETESRPEIKPKRAFGCSMMLRWTLDLGSRGAAAIPFPTASTASRSLGSSLGSLSSTVRTLLPLLLRHAIRVTLLSGCPLRLHMHGTSHVGARDNVYLYPSMDVRENQIIYDCPCCFLQAAANALVRDPYC